MLPSITKWNCLSQIRFKMNTLIRAGMPIFLRSSIKMLGITLSNAPLISKSRYSRGVVDKPLINVTSQNNKTIKIYPVGSPVVCQEEYETRFDIPLYTNINHSFHNFQVARQQRNRPDTRTTRFRNQNQRLFPLNGEGPLRKDP